ncbi:zinc-binding dehydrogenase [Cryptosporangium minutisporangium]|uniref:Zinc-binding dehydrogenase n=1 Tax=Cryptosporangium minutisporangium TaxID=113569 RepID=A0ABP6TAG9_9ACTN
MFAAYAARIDDADPLSALEVGDVPDPTPPDGWVVVDVVASALNHHDLWSLKGVGLGEDALPMILGCDAAGRDPDGNEVVVYPVVADPATGKTSILSEKFPGTLAEKVAVPRASLVPKPAELSFAEAACLPTAWLTAYRMLVSCGQVGPGSSVLVQGAGGGVATAAVAIGVALGATVYATSRDASKRERAEKLGAVAVESGARLPERVDCVIETVGEATFDHSQKSLKPGGRLVVSGATSGHLPRLDLRRLFFHNISVLGTSMGSPEELAGLLALCARTGLRPIIDSTFTLANVRDAFAHLHAGDVFGKVVVTA